MLRNFHTLEDVEKYIKENLPDWTTSRTSKKSILFEDDKHAKNAKFVKVFKPNESNKPFAEIWKGYSKFSPNDYLAIVPIYMTDIDHAMESIIEEDKILKNSSCILRAVDKLATMDAVFKEVYKRQLTTSDIYWSRGLKGKYWTINFNAFTCVKGQKCLLSIIPEVTGETRSLCVSYKIVDKDDVTNVYQSNSVLVAADDLRE